MGKVMGCREVQSVYYDGYNQTGTIIRNEMLLLEEIKDRIPSGENPTLSQLFAEQCLWSSSQKSIFKQTYSLEGRFEMLESHLVHTENSHWKYFKYKVGLAIPWNILRVRHLERKIKILNVIDLRSPVWRVHYTSTNT